MNEVFRTASTQFKQKLPQLTQNQEVCVVHAVCRMSYAVYVFCVLCMLLLFLHYLL